MALVRAPCHWRGQSTPKHPPEIVARQIDRVGVLVNTMNPVTFGDHDEVGFCGSFVGFVMRGAGNMALRSPGCRGQAILASCAGDCSSALACWPPPPG